RKGQTGKVRNGALQDRGGVPCIRHRTFLTASGAAGFGRLAFVVGTVGTDVAVRARAARERTTVVTKGKFAVLDDGVDFRIGKAGQAENALGVGATARAVRR